MANIQVSKAEVTRLRDRLANYATRTKNALHKADKVVETGVRSLVVGATALGCGTVQGLYGAQEVMGVPVELIGSIAAHAAGFAGVGGKTVGAQMHAVGDGFLAAYAVTVGRGLGASMAAKKPG